jgi:restriction endonuclease
MEPNQSTTWQTYEEVARLLLDQLREEVGLERVEGEQSLPGKSGTTWKIEGKGIKADDGAIVVIECRRKKRTLDQESVGGVANRIREVGADGGIIVTPIGLQKGAQFVAGYNNIDVVRLNADATTTDYVVQFLEKVFVGASAEDMLVAFVATGEGVVT